MYMATIDSLNKEITEIKKDIKFIKHALKEDYELSEEAKEGLKKARETEESEYVDLE